MSATGPVGVTKPDNLSVIEFTPSDVLQIMASFLPAYHFMGNNAIFRVSKTFKDTLKHSHFKAELNRKKSIKALIDSCKTPQDALYILCDRSFFTQLSFSDFITVAAHHPTIASSLYHRHDFDNSGKEILKEISLKVAEDLLQDLINKIPGIDKDDMNIDRWPYRGPEDDSVLMLFVDFGSVHEAIAKRLLNNKSLSSRLTLPHLKRLSMRHESIAQRIIEEKRESLSPADIVNIVYKHKKLALNLFNDPQIRAQLGPNELFLLGCKHAEIAREIINMPDLLLSPQELCFLGSKHAEIARKILYMPDLLDQVTFTELEALAHTSETVATGVLDYLRRNNRLTTTLEVAIIIPHITLCKNFLEETTKLNSENINNLIMLHESLALKIFSTPDLRKLLTSSCIDYFGMTFSRVAHYIWNCPELRSKISLFSLFVIISNWPELIRLASADQKLQQEINSNVHTKFIFEAYKKQVEILEDVHQLAVRLRNAPSTNIPQVTPKVAEALPSVTPAQNAAADAKEAPIEMAAQPSSAKDNTKNHQHIRKKRK